MSRRDSGAGLRRPLSSASQKIAVTHLVEWGVVEDLPRGGNTGQTVADDAELIVSELVSNAVRFCAGPVTVKLSAHLHQVTIAVADDNPAPPVLRRAGHRDDGGRGLAIVAALSDEWGVYQYPTDRKEVWARLSLASGSSTGGRCANND